METLHIDHNKLGKLFKILSKPDALRILLLASRGIENSTYAIEELGISQKSYYTRMKALLEEGLVLKSGRIYRQTALGNIICSRFLPEIGRACDAKDELEILIRLEGTEFVDKVKKVFEDKIDIPGLMGSNGVKLIENYEALVIDVIDICDSAKENILLASNYCDTRVMEATIRSQERGVTNRIILGRKSLSSKLQQLKMMLSPAFTMAVINFVSKAEDLNELFRVVDLNYSFCVVDGYRIILKVSDVVKGDFLAAFSVNDQKMGKRLTDSYEELWKNGEAHTFVKFLSSLKSS